MLMEFDLLVDMFSYKDVILIYNTYVTVSNSLTSKKIHFTKELKLAFKWTNMLDDDSNIKNENKPLQTIKKLDKDRS